MKWAKLAGLALAAMGGVMVTSAAVEAAANMRNYGCQ